MNSSVIYVGVDVHKDTNSVCMYDSAENSIFAEAKLDAGTANLCKYLEKQVKDFALEEKEFIIGYEAGPTGFGLQRRPGKERLHLLYNGTDNNQESFRRKGKDRP